MEMKSRMNEEQTKAHPTQHDDEIDLMALYAKIMERKSTIIFTVIGFAIIGILYAKFQPSIYRAEALLQVEAKQGGMPGLADLDGLFTTESEAVTEVEIIKSKMVIGEVVDTLQLDIAIKLTTIPNLLPELPPCANIVEIA